MNRKPGLLPLKRGWLAAGIMFIRTYVFSFQSPRQDISSPFSATLPDLQLTTFSFAASLDGCFFARAAYSPLSPPLP